MGNRFWWERPVATECSSAKERAAPWKRCRKNMKRTTEIKARAKRKIMKRLTLLLGGLALGATVALTPSVARAGLIGSEHDFSPSGPTSFSQLGIAKFVWGGETNTYQNPCQVCHIPHKAAAYSAANAPLWNHAVATNATTKYITYDQAGSATFNALGLGTLTLGSSVACLSCHDGSIAINQSYGKSTFNGNGGVGTNAPSWSIETAGGATGTHNDLTIMHPIGVSYPAAQAAAPGTLNNIPANLSQILKGPTQT